MDLDVIERTWSEPSAKLRPVVKVQVGSFWLSVPRDHFTRAAEKHFELTARPAFGDVTLQIAVRNGSL